jgi:uncharacterized protein (TIGR03437 family)
MLEFDGLGDFGIGTVFVHGTKHCVKENQMFSRFLALGFLLTVSVSSSAVFAMGPDQLEGPLTVVVTDYFKQHKEKTRYYIKDTKRGQSFEVKLAHEPALVTGMVIKSTGILSGTILKNADFTVKSSPIKRGMRAMSFGPKDSGAASLPDTTPVTGVQRTLVFLLQSATTPSYFTFNQLTDIMFSTSGQSVNTYYQANSYQANVSVTGDVVGPYVINVPATCDTATVDAEANQALQNDTSTSIKAANYQHLMYMMPVELWDICTFGGNSTVGGNPSISNINTGDYFPTGPGELQATNVVLNHELGHGMGMNHAQGVEVDGSVVEYGDNSCTMGDEAYHTVNFNVPHMIEEGFIPLTNIQQITQSGTYTVTYAETQTSAYQALQILPPGATTPIYISYRQSQPGGADAGLSSGFTQGVTIHSWAGGNSKPQLLTTAWGGSLQDKQSFSPNANLTITQISHNSTTATAAVVFNPPAPVPTTVTLTNSASNSLTVAPNSLASIYGVNIPAAPPGASALSVPLPTTLGGIQVLVNGTVSPLLYVSPTQINFQLPPDGAGQPTTVPSSSVVVTFNGQQVGLQSQVPVAEHAIGMFTAANPNAGQPAYLNALVNYYPTGQPPSAVYHTVVANSQGGIALNPISLNPALGVPFLSIYATGLNGTGTAPTVYFNGNPVATSYSGPQGDPGLDQINVQIPTNLNLNGVVSVEIKGPGYDQTVLMQVSN